MARVTWNAGAKAEFERMWRAGAKMWEFERRFGLAESSVRVRAARLGLGAADRPGRDASMTVIEKKRLRAEYERALAAGPVPVTRCPTAYAVPVRQAAVEAAPPRPPLRPARV